jgi:RHS repeat-associated protein
MSRNWKNILLRALVAAWALCIGATHGATFVVTNTASSGAGSLSQAIQSANNSAGANTISFNLPGTGPQTISGQVPTLTGTMTIDGTTQPGYAGMPLINIAAGITVSGSQCQLLALSAGGSNGTTGIQINGPGGSNVVRGCFIGTGPYGTNSLGLTGSGVSIGSSSGNQIGGVGSTARNLVWAGSNAMGITIGGSGAQSNVIQGNWIGVDVTGTNRMPGSVGQGIVIQANANNIIGGATAGAGNVVVGSSSYAIYLSGSSCVGNVIQGNRVGTDPGGTLGLGNGLYGIQLDQGASSNTIGGTTALAGNVISSNAFSGINVWGNFSPPEGGNNIVQGNFIGTDVTGTRAIPNGGAAIFIDSSVGNLIGGSASGSGNLLSGNLGTGLLIYGDSNIVQGNIIGLNVSGTGELPNGGDGIFLGYRGNQIGGGTPGSGNIVSANQTYGIYDYGGISNHFQGNFIGTDITGQMAMGNTYDGISLDSTSWDLIGGTNSNQGNLISGNGTEGICIGRYATSSNVVILNNMVGVAAPAGGQIGSVGRNQVPGPKPKGGPVLSPLCTGSFDGTYGSYPFQVISMNNDCPPNNLNWCSDNVFCCCYNSAVDIVNPTTCWFGGNSLICPKNSNPITTSGSPAPPTMTLNTDNTVSVGVSGPANGSVGLTVYEESSLSQFFLFTPAENTTVNTGANGAGNGTIDPASVPLAGANNICACVSDPCYGISSMCSAVSVSSGGGGTGGAVTPPGTTAANCVWGGNSGCPVSTFTGELYEAPAADLALGGPLPLQFKRYYAAWIKRDGFISGSLGDNWLHNFEMRLIPSASNVVWVITQVGRVIQFTNSAAGTFAVMGRTDIPFQLVTNGTGYVMGDPTSQRLYSFDSAGHLTQIADGRGNAQSLTYSGGLLASVSDGLGHSLSFSYSGGGQLTNVSDGTRTVSFAQTGTDLTGFTDALGNVTTYSYTNNSVSALMTSRTQPEGNAPFVQTFDAEGRVSAQIEAGVFPGTNTFNYVSSNSTIVSDPLTYSWQDSYTYLGELTNSTDPAGHKLSYTYNTNGQRISVTDRLGYTTLLGYHAPSGKMSSITNPDGGIVTFSYTSHSVAGMTFYDLSRIAYPDGTSEMANYDSQGNMISHTDRAGLVCQYAYNSRGQVLSATNPAGGVITLTYNPDATMATRSDSDTGTTTYQYDQFRRLVKVTNPDLTSSQRTYDADNRLTSATDELGRVFQFAYDRNGNLRQMTDPNGNSTRCAYDARNRLIAVTNRVGGVSTFVYDPRGLMVTNISSTGDVTGFTYDSRRRPVSVNDPAGNPWNDTYDNEDLLASATTPDGQTTTLLRNTMGLITNTADPLTNIISFSRDSMQRVVVDSDPLARSNNYSYEARGVVAGAARQGIGKAVYHYNSLGLLSELTDLNSNTWSFAYTPMGRPQSISDPLGRTRTFSHDIRGRLQRTVFADGSSCTNVYDAAGNPVGKQYSGGPALQFNYDAQNRLASTGDLGFAFDAEGRMTNTSSSGVNFGASYDAKGRLTSVSYYNGAFSVFYSYDRRGFLTNVTDTLTSARVAMAYDASDRLISMTRGNGVNGAYLYDFAGRLTNITEGSIINLQFGLDAAGEITRENLSVPSDPAALLAPSLQNLVYDSAHQIANGGYAYDARGRLIASPGHQFSWDGASRLTGVDGVTMTYNGLNQLLTRTQNGNTERYFYNRAILRGPIMAERNEATGTVQRYYVWSPGGWLLYMIDMTRSSAVSYFHFDQLGSTLALTAANGTVSDSYAYTPYGALLNHSGTNTQPFLYIGEYGVRGESAAGLYDMRARYYDPASARFLTPDPVWPRLGRPESLDPYEYALRNPTRYYDPSGTCEPGAGNAVSSAGLVLDTFAAGLLNAGNTAQTAADLANSKAASIATYASETLFDWYQAYINGTVTELGQGLDVAYQAYTEEEAVQLIAYEFAQPAGAIPEDIGKAWIFTKDAAYAAKRLWYANVGEEVETLATEGAQLSGRASVLSKAGTGLAVVGIGVQTTVAVYEDYKNGAGVVVTATDAASTISANAAIMAAPPLAAVDLVTGGAVSGGIHNALMTPNTVARVALGRVSTGDADAIKATYTRFAVGRWAWFAGEYYANLIFGDGPVNR